MRWTWPVALAVGVMACPADPEPAPEPEATPDVVQATDHGVEPEPPQPDVAVEPDICSPFCQPGWQCGPDGCGGRCSTGCDAGWECNNLSHRCQPPESPPCDSFGQHCGRTGDCQPMIDTADGPVDNPNWPACMNAQCMTGQCFEPVCIQHCIITKDDVDHAGEPGSDGINDPDAAFNDCGCTAFQGVMGNNAACVSFGHPEQTQGVNFCMFGTTFAPCSHTGECPDGETCQLHYILGKYTTRCSSTHQAAVAIGEYCNRNPQVGNVQYCETAQCLAPGCTGFCAHDSHCPADSMYCRKDFAVFGESYPELTVDMCWGKPCSVNADCPGGDHYCRVNLDGAGAWAHFCAAAAPNAAKLGEACEDNQYDSVPKPPCAGPCPDSGVCSAICESDADCAAGGVSMKCSVKDRFVGDVALPLGLCRD